jgi:hypothetical protein
MTFATLIPILQYSLPCFNTLIHNIGKKQCIDKTPPSWRPTIAINKSTKPVDIAGPAPHEKSTSRWPVSLQRPSPHSCETAPLDERRQISSIFRMDFHNRLLCPHYPIHPDK